MPNEANLGRPECLEAFFQDSTGGSQMDVQIGDAEQAVPMELGENNRDSKLVCDQLLAALGHDLRNRLAPISTVAMLLDSPGLAPEDYAYAASILRQTSSRAIELAENVSDLICARLGDGLVLRRQPVDLIQTLLRVIDEVRLAHPDRTVETHISINTRVACDEVRVAQLGAILLENALTHGSPAHPTQLSVIDVDGVLELSVTHWGDSSASRTGRRHSEPASVQDLPTDGLDLGLLIAAEIARAHGGMLRLASSASQTRFTFSMDCR